MKLLTNNYEKILTAAEQLSKRNPENVLFFRNHIPTILPDEEDLLETSIPDSYNCFWIEGYWQDGHYWHGEAV